MKSVMKIRPFQFPFLGSKKRSLLAKEIRRTQFAMAISMMKKSAELSSHCMLSSGAGPKNVIRRREPLPFPSFYQILRKKVRNQERTKMYVATKMCQTRAPGTGSEEYGM